MTASLTGVREMFAGLPPCGPLDTVALSELFAGSPSRPSELRCVSDPAFLLSGPEPDPVV